MKFDTGIQAAQDMGIRFHLARGAATLSQSKGGGLPDTWSKKRMRSWPIWNG